MELCLSINKGNVICKVFTWGYLYQSLIKGLSISALTVYHFQGSFFSGSIVPQPTCNYSKVTLSLSAHLVYILIRIS